MERGVPVRSVCRSIEALQAINRYGSLPLMEIARLIDLPYPTAYRIVQTLVHKGLIECEPTRKRYRVTGLVQSLSSGYRNEGKLVTVARPFIVALTKKIFWPIGVSTHVGQWMMVRDSTNALTSLTFTNYQPGYTFPLLGCASGHVFLAYTSDEERRCVLKGLEVVEGRSLMLTMFESGQLVKRIREDGYATNDRTLYSAEPGKTSSISVPIFENNEIFATLTLTYFSSAMSLSEAVKRYVEELKGVAGNISNALSSDELGTQQESTVPLFASAASNAKPQQVEKKGKRVGVPSYVQPVLTKQCA